VGSVAIVTGREIAAVDRFLDPVLGEEVVHAYRADPGVDRVQQVGQFDVAGGPAQRYVERLVHRDEGGVDHDQDGRD